MIDKNLCFIVSPTSATTATTAATTATHTHTLNMYLSEHELNAILQTPYYCIYPSMNLMLFYKLLTILNPLIHLL
jgi:hypothetical protein